jgi:hypothetical protein
MVAQPAEGVRAQAFHIAAEWQEFKKHPDKEKLYQLVSETMQLMKTIEEQTSIDRLDTRTLQSLRDTLKSLKTYIHPDSTIGKVKLLGQRLLWNKAEVSKLFSRTEHLSVEIERCLEEKVFISELEREELGATAEEFEEKAYRCYDQLKSGSLVNRRFYRYWTIRLFEKAINLYGQRQDFEKIAALRLKMCNLNLKVEQLPLARVLSDIDRPKMVPNHLCGGEMNLGIGSSDVDGDIVKRGSVQARKVTLDQEEKIVLNITMTAHGVRGAQANMRLLARPEIQEKFKAIVPSIEVRREPFIYPVLRDGKLSSVVQDGAVPMGTALVVHFPGIGKVEIGDDVFATLNESVRITLEPNVTMNQLKDILILTGLGALVSESTHVSEEKLKAHTILHALYPRIAARMESPRHYSMSMEDFLKAVEIEGDKEGVGRGVRVVEEIRANLDKLSKIEIAPGRYTYRMSELDKEVYLEGGLGFVSGVGDKQSVENTSTIMAALIQGGMLSSQMRYGLGILKGGDSVPQDHQSKAADSVFTRLITRNALGFSIAKTPLRGNYQILWNLSIANRLPYCHRRDSYGCRNMKLPRFGQDYEDRPSLLEHVRENQKAWLPDNEVMFKNYLGPENIAGISYQDPRKELLQELLARNPNFFPENVNTEARRLDYISSNKGEAINVMGEKWQGFSIDTHWCVDPKQSLVDKLYALNIREINGVAVEDFIVERNEYSLAMMSCCYRPE